MKVLPKEPKQTGFFPTQIIFAASNRCNLKCEHCNVNRTDMQLDLQKAKRFLLSCKATGIERIGFSGGEPFLCMDFVEEICKTTVKMGLMFGRIMTNGIWWQTEEQLQKEINRLYKAGFDGKIGVSYDSFHNQTPQKIALFCKNVFSTWNDGALIEIQSAVNQKEIHNDMQAFHSLAKELDCDMSYKTNRKDGTGTITLKGKGIFLPVYRTPRTFSWQNPEGWNSKKWFKEDFCAGPGNVLYIHPNGSIAPCCGFANERKALQIGNVSQSFSQIMESAKKKPMVQICYNQGLSNYRKNAQKSDCKFPGKTADNCTFCDFLCDNIKF